MVTAVSDYIDIANEAQGNMAIGTTGAQSDVISNTGIYDVYADIDCFLQVDSTASDVTTGTGYPLFANNVVPVRIASGNRLGAITASGSGTIYWHKVQS